VKTTTPGERFERALADATRALAGEKNLEVAFGDQAPKLAGGKALLPHPTVTLPELEAGRLRGYADGMALRTAYHDAGVHARYRPSGQRARELFDAVEDMRCQSLGANVLRGVRENLTAALTDALEKRGVGVLPGTRTAGMTDAIVLLVREALTGEPPPPVASTLMARWRAEIEAGAARTLGRLRAVAHDQQRFARLVHTLVRDVDLGYELGPVAERAAAEATTEDPGAPPEPQAQPASRDLRVKVASAEMEQERPDEIDADASSLIRNRSEGAERQPEVDPKGERLTRVPMAPERDDPNRLYRVYTRAHDEIIGAEQLCDAAELARLRAALDQQSRPLQRAVIRLANRLQRLLLVTQKRRWSFDLEEGVLDAGRLARVIVDPLAPLSFKDEEDAEFKDTVVSLLLDNSGSMRGRPILLAALCADVLARTLERCGVKVEILGFTTRSWNGGKSREDWLKAGAPPQPGRLSDLRHIVYKPADVPWRRTRQNLGVLLREDLLLENIDGEALLWAHERLLARSEQRRILMVISDGVPLDEATLSANPGSYLEQHLRNVVNWIETRSPIELVAIGIGHDVTDYYRRAVAIEDAEQLGGAMTEQLAALFADPATAGRTRSRA
jgi:cobaltochelatase CobT